MLRELRAQPGVRSVSLAEEALMTGNTSSGTVTIEGYQAAEDENMSLNINGIAPGFFSTLGIQLLSGRDFTDADDAAGPKVAIVNESFVHYFFGENDPLGRPIGFTRGEPDITIVGVLRDAKSATIRDDPVRFVYLPHTQRARDGRAKSGSESRSVRSLEPSCSSC